jgi:hypothetical protein
MMLIVPKKKNWFPNKISAALAGCAQLEYLRELTLGGTALQVADCRKACKGHLPL